MKPLLFALAGFALALVLAVPLMHALGIHDSLPAQLLGLVVGGVLTGAGYVLGVVLSTKR